ncbi:beta-galactosidase [Marisediminicola antarctica]|uniref:beta-galactosidase n=1 Tax=Marisediminicola antarctica TaxID=674079 RepID=UPI003AB67382
MSSTTDHAPAVAIAPAVGTRFASVGIEYGCDYNPEQWSREVWNDDVRLMRQAGVTLVAINVFGWAVLEPRSGEFDFSGLDAIVGLLHENGIGINLGTGTSSPPPWLTRQHPEILPMAADGTRRWPGGRQAWCPSSPVFREHALALVTEVAARYGSHPAVRLWHVSNELGCHNALCYCDVSAESFRGWLERRYGSIDALNEAWGTSFWSQRYSEWADVLPPRATLSAANPTQAQDFSRFSSDELLSYYLAEAGVLRELSAVPVTTNFMITAHIRTQDYWSWAPHVDVIANDHYLDHRLDDPHQELAFAADLTRGLAGGGPWVLMEQATGSVNWQPRNIAKAPGEMVRNSLSHLARGADGICFFQWRASASGSEKFHSGMVPHAGTDTGIWRDVLELGRVLGALSEVAGSRVVADAAIVFSWDAWWAVDFESRPSGDLRYLDQVHRAYRELWDAGITVDIVAPGADLSAYRFVVVPCLYLVTEDAARGIRDYVAGGGHALVTFFSGIVDENDRILLGGYPGAFKEMLGVVTEEFFPLGHGDAVALDDGSTATVWTEWMHARGAEVIASYADGTLAGVPAITRNRHGDGVAWYLGTALEAGALGRLLVRASSEAGVSATRLAGVPGVEVVRRSSAENDYLFVMNHTDEPISHPAAGTELTRGGQVENTVDVPAGGVRVIRTPLQSASTTEIPAA